MIEEFEDAMFKNQRMPISYSELAALKEGRFNASIQHRLAELEGLRGTHFCTCLLSDSLVCIVLNNFLKFSLPV